MSAANPLAAALAYASKGWPVFPVRPDKVPLTSHGRSDASLDPAIINGWYSRHPSALVAVATGAEAGMVAVDVDVDEDRGLNGWDSLEALGVAFCPRTPCDHTPRGGSHLLFAHPGHFVKTTAGKLGPGLDIRGDGGSVILPPGPGRYWDPELGPDSPLAAFPRWAVIIEPERPAALRPAAKPISRYGEVALDRAVESIIGAPAGEQRENLNRECFAIGGLVAGGAIPAALAIDALKWAANRMPSHDPRRPWRQADVDRIVECALIAGQRRPREVANG